VLDSETQRGGNIVNFTSGDHGLWRLLRGYSVLAQSKIEARGAKTKN
jgi:hypothetical protein